MIHRAKTEVIDAVSDLKKAAAKTAELLRQGRVIGYPTETVYGLGCDALNSEAIKRIAQIKGREENKPFLVLLPDAGIPVSVSDDSAGTIRALMDAFWPGPLTLLVPHRNRYPDDLTLGQSLIGVRVSSDAFCRELAAWYDHPVVSTSANPAGEEPARSCRTVLQYFGGLIDAVVDGGVREAGQPSTILDVSSETPRLIREGAVPVETIEKHAGRPVER